MHTNNKKINRTLFILSSLFVLAKSYCAAEDITHIKSLKTLCKNQLVNNFSQAAQCVHGESFEHTLKMHQDFFNALPDDIQEELEQQIKKEICWNLMPNLGAQIKIANKPIKSLSFDKSCNHILISSRNKQISLLNVHDYVQNSVRLPSTPRSISYTQDIICALLQSKLHCINRWTKEMKTFNLPIIFHPSGRQTLIIKKIWTDQTSTHLYASFHNFASKVLRWNIDELMQKNDLEGKLFDAPKKDRLVPICKTNKRDNEIYIKYKQARKKTSCTIPIEAPTCSAFSSDFETLAVGQYDGTVSFFSCLDWQQYLLTQAISAAYKKNDLNQICEITKILEDGDIYHSFPMNKQIDILEHIKHTVHNMPQTKITQNIQSTIAYELAIARIGSLYESIHNRTHRKRDMENNPN